MLLYGIKYTRETNHKCKIKIPKSGEKKNTEPQNPKIHLQITWSNREELLIATSFLCGKELLLDSPWDAQPGVVHRDRPSKMQQYHLICGKTAAGFL